MTQPLTYLPHIALVTLSACAETQAEDFLGDEELRAITKQNARAALKALTAWVDAL